MSTVAVSRREKPAIALHAELRWIVRGLALAFVVPFVCTDILTIDRDLYYAIYVGAVFAFVGAWVRETQLPLRRFLTRGWKAAIPLALLAGAALIATVLREPSTTHPHGLSFIGAILWRGVVYGAADGLLLSVFPILAVFAAFGSRPLRERSKRAVAGIAVVALATSLVFTAVYHLGYPDFRGGKVKKPLAGALIWSLPTLATASPLGAPIAHAALHVSAVVHSYRTDLFLPPHQGAHPQALAFELVAAAPVARTHAVSIFAPRGVGNDCARVAPLARTVPGPRVLQSAMRALLAGPTNVERARGYRGWFSAETAGHLRSVRIASGVAYVDFRTFAAHIPNASTSCGSTLLLAQLDRTAKQFPAVRRTVYSFDGSRVAFYEWLQRAAPRG